MNIQQHETKTTTIKKRSSCAYRPPCSKSFAGGGEGGVPTLAGGTYLGQGRVPALVGGTYLDWGVPTLGRGLPA